MLPYRRTTGALIALVMAAALTFSGVPAGGQAPESNQDDQQVQARQTARLLAGLAKADSGDLAGAAGFAKEASAYQAEGLGLGQLSGSAPVKHQMLSQSVFELLKLYEVDASPQDESSVKELDNLPKPARDALGGFIQSFLNFDRATRQAVDGVSPDKVLRSSKEVLASRLQLTEATQRLGLALDSLAAQGSSADTPSSNLQGEQAVPLRLSTFSAPEELPSEPSDPIKPEAPALGPSSTPEELPSGTSDSINPEAPAPEPFESASPVAPPSKHTNASAPEALPSAPSTRPTAQSFSAANQVIDLFPALFIDLQGQNSTYPKTRNYALVVDAGGNDIYLNNAGGSRLQEGPCVQGPPNSGASALFDNSGNDQYRGAGTCGVNGGAYGGSGFLYDRQGNDEYGEGGLNKLAVNGGASVGFGFLLDAGGDDQYVGQGSGTNGGAEFGGAGLLLDLGGSDSYQDPLVPSGSCRDCSVVPKKATGVPGEVSAGAQLDSQSTGFVTISDSTVTNPAQGNFVNASFTVALDYPQRVPVSIRYSTSDGTAGAPFDYASQSGTVAFGVGEISKTVSVVVHGDELPEDNEKFFVNLSDPSNINVADGQGVGTIVSNDRRLLDIHDGSGNEKDAGERSHLDFKVSLSEVHDKPVTVEFETADGTARKGQDYEHQKGKLMFLPGSLEEIVTVVITGDDEQEADETFVVNLSNPDEASIIDGQAVGKIIDRESGNLSIDDSKVIESDYGNISAQFTVHLKQPRSYKVSVDWATSEGTAKKGQDYAETSSKLEFAPGETEKHGRVIVFGDETPEPNETFFVTITSSEAVRYRTGKITIIDDDRDGSDSINLVRTLGKPGNVNEGIDHHLEKIMVPANRDSAGDHELELVAQDGSASHFANYGGGAPNMPEGIATVRRSDCQGGFEPGDVYFGTYYGGGLGRVASDGSPRPGIRFGDNVFTAFQDRYCAFGGDFFAIAGWHEIWRINSQGESAKIAHVAYKGSMSALTTTPNSSEYGPWAGKILVDGSAHHEQPCIYSIDANGFFECLLKMPDEMLIGDIDIIPENENFFAVDKGSNAILAAGSEEFDRFKGGVLITESGGEGRLYVARWNGAGFDVDKISRIPASWGDVTFSCHGIDPVKYCGWQPPPAPSPNMTIGDVAIKEGDSGTSMASVEVNLDSKSDQAVLASYATEGRSAKTDEDFTTSSGTIEFAPNQIAKTIQVPIRGDTEVEPDENLVIKLFDVQNAVISKAEGTVTILNDDTVVEPERSEKRPNRSPFLGTFQPPQELPLQNPVGEAPARQAVEQQALISQPSLQPQAGSQQMSQPQATQQAQQSGQQGSEQVVEIQGQTAAQHQLISQVSPAMEQQRERQVERAFVNDSSQPGGHLASAREAGYRAPVGVSAAAVLAAIAFMFASPRKAHTKVIVVPRRPSDRPVSRSAGSRGRRRR